MCTNLRAGDVDWHRTRILILRLILWGLVCFTQDTVSWWVYLRIAERIAVASGLFTALGSLIPRKKAQIHRQRLKS